MHFYPFLKALHIIGFVSWFAGLFYLVRIFVYHAEVEEKPDHLKEPFFEQFELMQQRVFSIIATPGMYITWFGGLSMLYLNSAILNQNWIRIKLALLVLLVFYHFYCKKIIKEQKERSKPRSSQFFRMLNELPSLFLVAIVLLAVIKDFLNFLYLFLGVLAFGILLFIFIKLYKNQRANQKH
jgi:protoporphyrinogen IX oxidase